MEISYSDILLKNLLTSFTPFVLLQVHVSLCYMGSVTSASCYRIEWNRIFIISSVGPNWAYNILHIY